MTSVNNYLKADGAKYWTIQLCDAFRKPQPSNSANDNCTAMFLLNEYTPVWIKVPCQLGMGYSKIICEYQQDTGHSPLMISRSPKECPVGWIFTQENCYSLMKFAPKLSIAQTLVEHLCHDSEGARIGELEHLYYLKRYFSILLGEKSKAYLLMRINSTIHHQPYCALVPSDLETRFDIRYENDLYQSTCIALMPIAHGVVCQMEACEIDQDSCLIGLYQCEDKTCILEKYICDGTVHCPDRTDETNCTDVCMMTNGKSPNLQECFTEQCRRPFCYCSWKYFQCLQGGCVPWWSVCDCISHCPDGSDETQCAYCQSVRGQVTQNVGIYDNVNTHSTILMPFAQNCTSAGFNPCGIMSSGCFPTEALCVFERLPENLIRYCRNGAHLLNCYNFECPNYYKCSFTYCIPLFKVCNGEFDCPNGEDEVSCNDTKCQNLLKCAKESSCVHPKDIHDGVTQCLFTGDDEDPFIAHPCPKSCLCRGHSLKCNYVDLISIPSVYYKVKGLYLRDSNVKYSRDTFTAFHELLGLDISNNNLSYLHPNLFVSQSQLIILNLSHNNLKHILRSSLQGLFNLRYINLHFNPIQTLDSMSFSSLAVIDYVDLSELTISVVKNKALYGMQHCRQINLSYNEIVEIATGAFLGLPQLNVLDLRGNPIVTFSPADFITIRMLPVVYMPVSEFCCKGTFPGSCYPTTTTLTCYQYIQSRVLKILGWCMVGLIGLTKGLMIIWHSRSKRKSLLPTIMLKYSVEMLMGLSIAVILLMDQMFQNFFVTLYLKVLTTSPMCLSANFVYIFSFEMSAFTSLVLVICKTLAVISPLKAKLLLTQTRLYLSALFCTICVILLSFLVLSRDAHFSPKALGVSCGLLITNTEQTIPASYIVLLGINTSIANLITVFSGIAVQALLAKGSLLQANLQLRERAQITSNKRRAACTVLMLMAVDCTGIVTLLIVNILIVCGIVVNKEVEMILTIIVLPVNVILEPILNALILLQRHRCGKS